MQINYDNNHKTFNILDNNYKVDGKIITKNKAAYKYKTPYTGPYGIT